MRVVINSNAEQLGEGAPTKDGDDIIAEMEAVESQKADSCEAIEVEVADEADDDTEVALVTTRTPNQLS